MIQKISEDSALLSNHEYKDEEPWRIFKIMSEFVDGFEVLS